MARKTAVFIDGSNLYATAKALGLDIDYRKLLNYYGDDLLRAFYYTAILDDKEAYVSIKPLVDWLQYNGYCVVTKLTKSWTDPNTGMTKIKGNMDGELIVQAMELRPHIDRMVLFSGDGDFVALIQAMQRHGVRVDLVSSISSRPNSMCSDELRRAADTFTDLGELGKHFVNDRSNRSRFTDG